MLGKDEIARALEEGISRLKTALTKKGKGKSLKTSKEYRKTLELWHKAAASLHNGRITGFTPDETSAFIESVTSQTTKDNLFPHLAQERDQLKGYPEVKPSKSIFPHKLVSKGFLETTSLSKFRYNLTDKAIPLLAKLASDKALTPEEQAYWSKFYGYAKNVDIVSQDIVKKAHNQRNGMTSAGEPLKIPKRIGDKVLPVEERTETPSAKAKIITDDSAHGGLTSQEKLDFLNLLENPDSVHEKSSYAPEGILNRGKPLADLAKEGPNPLIQRFESALRKTKDYSDFSMEKYFEPLDQSLRIDRIDPAHPILSLDQSKEKIMVSATSNPARKWNFMASVDPAERAKNDAMMKWMAAREAAKQTGNPDKAAEADAWKKEYERLRDTKNPLTLTKPQPSDNLTGNGRRQLLPNNPTESRNVPGNERINRALQEISSYLRASSEPNPRPSRSKRGGTQLSSIYDGLAQSEKIALEKAALRKYAESKGLITYKDLLFGLKPLGHGAEHQVALADSGDKVIKQTLPQKVIQKGYGLSPKVFENTLGKLSDFEGPYRVEVANASPSEYFDRLRLGNEVFKDSNELKAIDDSDGTVITEQPFHQGVLTDPSKPHDKDDNPHIKVTPLEIDTYMRSAGFKAFPDKRLGKGIANPTYWYRDDGMLAADTHSGNFIKTEDGIVPIDIPLSMVPGDVADRLAKAYDGRQAELIKKVKNPTPQPRTFQFMAANDHTIGKYTKEWGHEGLDYLHHIFNQFKKPNGELFSPEEAKAFLDSQPDPYPILGNQAAKALEEIKNSDVKGKFYYGSRQNYDRDILKNISAKHNMTPLPPEDAGRPFNAFSKRGGVFLPQDLDVPKKTDLSEVSYPHSLLHFQNPKTIRNKFEDARQAGYHVVSQKELGVKPDTDIEDLFSMLDKHFGENNWFWKTNGSQDGAGKYVQAAEQAKDHWFNQNDYKEPIEDLLPYHRQDTYFQEKFPVVGQTEDDRREGNLIVPGSEFRVHVTSDPKGNPIAVPYATFRRDRSLAVENMSPNTYTDSEIEAVQEKAEEIMRRFPKEDRTRTIRSMDMVMTKEGTDTEPPDFECVEFNPAYGAYGGYLINQPLTLDAFVCALKGELPTHAKVGRHILHNLSQGAP
jgi:hypothetical protein